MLLEGLQAGRPIVASAVGGIPDIVADGVNGRLVPPSDPAAALDEVLGAPLTERGMGAASRRRAPDFHWDALAARVLGVYEEVVCEAGHRPLAVMDASGA